MKFKIQSIASRMLKAKSQHELNVLYIDAMMLDAEHIVTKLYNSRSIELSND